jgi:hypothetical protein
VPNRAANGGLMARNSAIIAAMMRSTKPVLTSGFPDLRVGHVPGPVAKLRMLGKPYRKEDLARTLRETFSP